VVVTEGNPNSVAILRPSRRGWTSGSKSRGSVGNLRSIASLPSAWIWGTSRWLGDDARRRDV